MGGLLIMQISAEERKELRKEYIKMLIKDYRDENSLLGEIIRALEKVLEDKG
jgi:hypothetical protein